MLTRDVVPEDTRPVHQLLVADSVLGGLDITARYAGHAVTVQLDRAEVESLAAVLTEWLDVTAPAADRG
jgi:hypothetical protein